MDQFDQIKTPLLAYYQEKIDLGEIDEDPAQVELLQRLEILRKAIVANPLPQSSNWFSKLFKARPKRSPHKGYYIWGEVGRGKSMIMDLFFDHLPIKSKRRVHFHEFMQEIHQAIHDHRQAYKAGKVKIEDPIQPVADRLINEASVLCFDEFVVRDIADAMILARIFSRLFNQGLIMLATSNVAPQALYKDGLNRALFLPFLKFLDEQTETYRLDARTDFRMEKMAQMERYLSPLNMGQKKQLEEIWDFLVKENQGAVEHNGGIKHKGRNINVPQSIKGLNGSKSIARFSFDDLCKNTLAAGDYLAITKKFHTLLISDVPIMKAEDRNEAKRFIILIDTLYDQEVDVFISAAAKPKNLYQGKSGDEAFEFARTASRLHEMSSPRQRV